MLRRVLIPLVAITVAVTACGNDKQPSSPVASLAAVSSSPTPDPVADRSASPPATVAPTPVPTRSPAPTPTPVPTPDPTPIPWNTHKSKRFHYVIKYPPAWVVTPGNAKLADAYDGYDYPYVYVSRDTVANTVSISRTVSADMAYNKSHYKAKVVSNKPIKLAGWSGRIVTYTGKVSGLKVIIQRIIVGKGRIGYFLTLHGEASSAAADKAIFKTMYRTFKPT